MEIDLHGQWYSIAYQASLILVFVYYLYEAHKRKFNWSQWFLLLLMTRVFMIMGSKIGGLHSEEIQFFTAHLYLPPVADKNMMFALIFGLLAIPLAKKILKINYPVFDAFAVATPLGMAVQRIGCLYGGCCFGASSDMPWAVHYHLDNFLSPGLHPVPLYYAVSSLAIAIVVFLSAKLWKRSGNLAFFSLSLLFLSRFIIDFFRDPESQSALLRTQFMGLYLSQWFSLTFTLVLIPIIYLRERNTNILAFLNFKRKTKDFIPFHLTIDKQSLEDDYSRASRQPLFYAIYLSVFVLIIYLIRNWLQIVEFWMIMLVLVPAAVLIIRQLFASYFNSYIRISTLGLLSLALILSSQSYPDKWKRSNTYGLSLGTGNIENISFCGDKISESHFTGVVGGYSQQLQRNNLKLELGANMMIAAYSTRYFDYNYYWDDDYQSTYTMDVITKQNTVFGINPFFKMDANWLGLGLGGSFGSFKDLSSISEYESHILPYLSVRLFPEKYFYMKYSFGDFFPYISSLGVSNFELGSGFGSDNDFRAGAGIMFDHDFGCVMLGANTQIPINNNIKFLVNYNVDPVATNTWSLNLGLKYSIPINSKWKSAEVNSQILLEESNPKDSSEITP